MEKVKIAAKEAQPKVKIITLFNFTKYNSLNRFKLFSYREIKNN